MNETTCKLCGDSIPDAIQPCETCANELTAIVSLADPAPIVPPACPLPDDKETCSLCGKLCDDDQSPCPECAEHLKRIGTLPTIPWDIELSTSVLVTIQLPEPLAIDGHEYVHITYNLHNNCAMLHCANCFDMRLQPLTTYRANNWQAIATHAANSFTPPF